MKNIWLQLQEEVLHYAANYLSAFQILLDLGQGNKWVIENFFI